MERLDTSFAPTRPNIEASIHFARYAIATPLVKGKKVLDIACGEGYGSYLLKQAGAEQVVGIDISSDAIERARNSFGIDGIEFLIADAASITSKFPSEFFDVVITCETIEHIENPVAYLGALKQVAIKKAIFLVSCPNDHWYFPQDHQQNPWHVRKYHFEEFKELTTSVLGEDVNWSVGTAVFGFGSTPVDVRGSYQSLPNSWMSYKKIGGAYLVNGGEEHEVSATNCSYFFGVWNAPETPIGTAVFPVSMDTYSLMVQAMDGRLVVNEIKKDLNALQAEFELNKLDLRKTGLRNQALKAENELLKESLHIYIAERQRMQLAYDRYLRLIRLIPAPIRAILIKVAKRLFGRSR